jgi:hypothetical protein
MSFRLHYGQRYSKDGHNKLPIISYGDWFTRFNKGCHKGMGDTVFSDRPISIEIMLEIFKMLENEWANASYCKYSVAVEGAFYMIAYFCTLKGEEVPKTVLNGIIKHWESSDTANPEHVVVSLLGQF